MYTEILLHLVTYSIYHSNDIHDRQNTNHKHVALPTDGLQIISILMMSDTSRIERTCLHATSVTQEGTRYSENNVGCQHVILTFTTRRTISPQKNYMYS